MQIRRQQMNSLGVQQAEAFRGRLISFLREDLQEGADVQVADLEDAIGTAEGYGLGTEQQVASFLVATLRLGSDFDLDEPDAGRLLSDVAWSGDDKASWLRELAAQPAGEAFPSIQNRFAPIPVATVVVPVPGAPPRKQAPKPVSRKPGSEKAKAGLNDVQRTDLAVVNAMIYGTGAYPGTKVNLKFLASFDGPQQTTGSVTGNSGVAVATGFDIGRHTPAQISELGLPEELAARLIPYAEVLKQDALDALSKHGPLVISKREADAIDGARLRFCLKSAADSWNAKRPDGGPAFPQLTAAQQTVLLSRTIHQGPGMPDSELAQGFYEAALKGDWAEAGHKLRSYGVSQRWYFHRVGQEADLLDGKISQP